MWEGAGGDPGPYPIDYDVALASRAENPMKNVPTNAFPMADNLRLPLRRLIKYEPQKARKPKYKRVIANITAARIINATQESSA